MHDVQPLPTHRPPPPLCLVTGGAAGLGYALARAFAEAGCDLVLAGGDDIELTLAAEELAFAGASVQVHCIGVDLAHPSGAAALHRKLRYLERPVDILVANASVGAWGDFGAAASLEDELAVVQTNTHSLLQLVRLVGRDMAQRGHGQIMLASSAAARACELVPVQSATRAFAVTLAAGLAEGFARRGVHVTSLAPEIEPDGACARLKDPGAVLALARAAARRASERHDAVPSPEPTAQRPPAIPTALGRILFVFGGSAEIPRA